MGNPQAAGVATDRRPSQNAQDHLGGVPALEALRKARALAQSCCS